MGKAINYIDKSYRYLKVLDQKREGRRTLLYCHCSRCGNEKWIRADHVTSGKIISCGCYNNEINLSIKDLTDQTFGLLTAKYDTGKRDKYNGATIWHCQCKCGGNKEVSSARLEKQEVISCGCVAKDWQTRHGKRLGAATKDFCIENTNVRNLTMRMRKDNISGHKGVTWDKERNKWKAQIRFQGKTYYLGRYHNLNDAVAVRKIAEDKIFGTFLQWYEQYMKELKEPKDTPSQ